MPLLLTTCQLSRRARRLVWDAQAMHRTIAHDLGRCLWAVPDDHTLVVQHSRDVDWLDVMGGVVSRSHTVPVSTPLSGVPVRWGLIANPTKCVRRSGSGRGKRVGLPPEGWKAWVQRRLGEVINIHSIDVAGLPPARGFKTDMRTTHARVLYTGVGTVANHDALRGAQYTGVGPGKAYGCGLLVVQEAV